MAGFVQAVGLDLDGTLTSGGSISDEAMGAVAALRKQGTAVLLVTGRILSELRHDFPDLAHSFDAVVAENGAVLASEETIHDLAAPVDDSLVQALGATGEISVRRGRVILACDGQHFDVVMHHIDRLGLDCQLLRNRSALMVLPAGVSKGTGFHVALDQLGLSAHNTLAIGDAENDLALIQLAEIGVAVANAVPSLRSHADLVLPGADGQGVAAFLAGPVVSGEQAVHPQRRQVAVGCFTDGGTATVPGAQANILICGDTGLGKSYLAGLLVERWVDSGYNVLVVDVEGDHIGLGQLLNTVILGEQALPTSEELSAFLRHPSQSVVLDLSALDPPDQLNYLAAIAPVLTELRAVHGLPHWIVLDEAHLPLGEGRVSGGVFRPEDLGYCLVTYRPQELVAAARAAIDITLTVTTPPPDGADVHEVAPTATLCAASGRPRSIVVGSRQTPHRRHWHKYAAAPLPKEWWFHFRNPDGQPAGTAGNIEQFVTMLRVADAAVVEYHLLRGDFSRWLTAAIQDRELAAVAGAVERDVVAHRSTEIEKARDRLADEVAARYSPPGRVTPSPPGRRLR
jgi:hydroxymethylpyrimidine pyrophosphatase-like HAD family hydrolase